MALEILKQRSSVRKFESLPVEREKLEQIMESARFAPTARNEQPWELVVVTAAEQLQKIADLTDYGKFIAEAPVCIGVFCRDVKYYLEDGCAMSTYILVAATALRLGCCWVAGDKKLYSEEIREILNVPEGYKLISLIALGYPAERLNREKRPAEQFVHWERF
ncbi:MAG TPA: nitroreductase family protein [Bacillota bacterium]|nr:nitroreductase family protein [Bacillota bacterium]